MLLIFLKEIINIFISILYCMCSNDKYCISQIYIRVYNTNTFNVLLLKKLNDIKLFLLIPNLIIVEKNNVLYT